MNNYLQLTSHTVISLFPSVSFLPPTCNAHFYPQGQLLTHSLRVNSGVASLKAFCVFTEVTGQVNCPAMLEGTLGTYTVL